MAKKSKPPATTAAPTISSADVVKAASDTSEAAMARKARARRATQMFSRLQPTLTGFARSLTGRDDVKVIAGAGSCTDGNTIFLRPPIELGDLSAARHSGNGVCDKRDSDDRQRCPACAVREEVVITLYHEVAHIAFDSFDTLDDAARQDVIERAVKHAAKRADGGTRAAKLGAALEARPPRNYMEAAHAYSPFLPVIVNALEDVRVNVKMYQSRPGTFPMFRGSAIGIFEDGIDFNDGEGPKLWKEAPDNAQAVVGLFCKAAGYDYADYFKPEIVAALDDPEIEAILRKVATVRSVAGIYDLAMPALEALRRLGYCLAPSDVEDDKPEPEPEPEEADEPDDEDTDGDDDTEGEPEEGEPGDDGEPEPGDGEPCEDGQPGEDGEPGEGDGEAENTSGGGVPGGTDPTGDGGSSYPSAELDDSDEPSDDGEPSDDEGEPSDDDSDADGEGDDGAEGDEPGDGDESDDDYDSDEDDWYGDDDGDADGEGDDDGSDADGDDGDEEAGDDGSGDADGDADSDGDSADGEPSDTGDAGTPSGEGTTAGGTDTFAEDLPDGDHGVSEGMDEATFAAGGGDAITHSKPRVDDSDEVDKWLKEMGDHSPQEPSEADEEDAREVARAVVQDEYFDEPAAGIFSVRIHTEAKRQMVKNHSGRVTDLTAEMFFGDEHSRYYSYGGCTVEEMKPAESIMGRSLLQMRLAFEANRRSLVERNKKSGPKINGRVLGRRAAVGDPRLFGKKTIPGKRDYHVVIGLDVSGSTSGGRLKMIKKAAFAQAELLARTGVSFEIWAHTGNYHFGEDGSYGYGTPLCLDVCAIKEANEPWDKVTRQRLSILRCGSANLDGHTLEFYRKRLDASNATDKVIMYYTDGAMPAENYEEELSVLLREIKECRRRGYTLLAVGIQNEEPEQYGLDTVRVDSMADVPKVVMHLGKRIAE